MFNENKASKFTEVCFYIILPFIIYFQMKSAKINLFGAPILFLGGILFLIAKISIIKKGIYFSFGCDNMSKKMMWIYFAGYLLMIIGYIITFSLIGLKWEY